jgi:hypothetical protein
MNKTSTPSKKAKNSSASIEHTEETMFEPRPHVIQNILNYSKSLTVKDSKSVGKIDIVQS